MTNNPSFPSPTPTLAVLQTAVSAAKPGAVSGVAVIVAPSAGARSSYEWQYSPDGGKTWVTAPPTVQAKTSVSGLATGTSVEFKYRAVTKDGAGDWSAPVGAGAVGTGAVVTLGGGQSVTLERASRTA